MPSDYTKTFGRRITDMYYDMLKARRSIRKFSDKEVEKEKLISF